MTRPIIGVTALLETVRFGAWNPVSALVPLSYVRAIEHAGGRALVVPPSDDSVDDVLEVLDGLVLSGGPDVDPTIYGADPHPETQAAHPVRDRAEIALVEAALERDLPVLAVCRGSQVFNVARGGDLVQHLPDLVGHEHHRHTPGVFGDHEVELDDASRLAAILGRRAPVKSHHHQGFGEIGEGLCPAAWAEDGTIEAVEDPSKRFAFGVLWHPEEGQDYGLFEALVDEARAYREERLGARA